MARKKENIRRAIEFVGIDKTIEIKKAARINSPKNSIYIEEIKEGSGEYRIVWTQGMFDELKDIEAFRMIREELDDQS